MKEEVFRMGRSKFTIVVYFVIVLAIIGVVSQLFTSPGSFLKGILITLGMAVILFGVLYYFLSRKNGSNSKELKKYKQAVKQSNAKYKENKHIFTQKTEGNKTSTKQPSHPKKKSRKRAHLRVIDGYKDKDKDKDRASY